GFVVVEQRVEERGGEMMKEEGERKWMQGKGDDVEEGEDVEDHVLWCGG
ncbi:hypothetical protein Pmani_033174, partial [Petrolisthes manimaculis]